MRGIVQVVGSHIVTSQRRNAGSRDTLHHARLAET